jgi:hypothetical protein
MLHCNASPASLDYNSPMRKNPASIRFVAALRAISAAPVFAQITKTTTIKG